MVAVVLVETDAGITGVGEAGLQRRWKAIVGRPNTCVSGSSGRTRWPIEHLWQRMFRGGFYPADRLIGSVMSAVDIALWDIKGQALGVPVYELLGGRCRDHVECFFQPGYLTSVVEHPTARGAAEGNLNIDEAEVRATTQRFLRRAFGTSDSLPMPWSVSSSQRRPWAAIRQLRAIRESAGDRLELMVDLHTRLSPPRRSGSAANAKHCGCSSWRIRSAPNMPRVIDIFASIPMCLWLQVQWSTKWEFRAAIEEELVDYVRADVCICGGISR